MSAYHLSEIQRGILGDITKISEEYLELMDAHTQQNRVLEICELCDLIGAIEAYAESFNLSLDDLVKMKESTKRAFEEGTRK